MTSLFDQRNAPLATSITPFFFEGFAVRTIQINGEPWFVAADVCGILGLENASQAIKGRADRNNEDGLEADEHGVTTVTTLGGQQKVIVINESGLYSLIFKSRKPSSKRFKRWVTGEVLPTIRKTGGYGQPAALSTMDILTLAIESEKGRLLALEQRDHAIATKAHIGSKREATAMATASAAKKESAKLKDQLGFSARHATILQVEDAMQGDFNFLPLRNWCKANEVIPATVPDKRYPKGVKAWPAGAWLAVYGVRLDKLFGEVAA